MSRRTFDSVSVGDTFGPTEVAVERETLVAYANASGDQNPIHQDEAFAKSVGLPDVIAHGMFTMGAAASLLTEWVGDPGRVVRYTTKFVGPVVVPYGTGADITLGGRVTAVDPDTREVVVELSAVCDGAKVLGRALATVALD